MITGAAGAIGKALCKRFHEEGALLVLVDKNK
jgi:NAD(P)-dependent dehydrogenase (short-subunit alcohol dehydrogenase family)